MNRLRTRPDLNTILDKGKAFMKAHSWKFKRPRDQGKAYMLLKSFEQLSKERRDAK